MIRNFISNAVKFTPTGGSISANASFIVNGVSKNPLDVSEGKLLFEVVDSGAGISLVRPNFNTITLLTGEF